MLYATTRSNRDVYTVKHAIQNNRGAGGGFFVPFHMPIFSKEEIDALAEKSFGQCVADVLNRLFNVSLSGWDVDFSVGRYPVCVECLRHRIYIAEPWHNPQWNYHTMADKLAALLQASVSVSGDWVCIGVRVAVLFGVFSNLKRMGIDTADISVMCGDFSVPISVWYARQWGLPVGNIICCCNENNRIWDLICQGQMRTDDVSISTNIPEADVAIPASLERLVYSCGGVIEVEKYLDACRNGKTYFPSDSTLAKMRKGLFVSVVSSGRVEAIIPSVYSTHGYLLTAPGALAYGGLLDYRAKTGEIRPAVVWSEMSPAQDIGRIAKILKISEDMIRMRLL